jgi:hypothetical protein
MMGETPKREGDGRTQVVVGPEDGKIVMGFPKPISWLAMEPDNAVQIAKSMIDSAVKLGANVQIVLPRRKLSEAKRTMLRYRVSLRMRSMLEKKRVPDYIAEEILVTVLQEVL